MGQPANAAVFKGAWNCRHSVSSWYEGSSQMPAPLDGDKIRRTAKLEQKQRELEREVRKYKRLQEGTQDAARAKEYGAQVRAAQKNLREFIGEHSDVLRRDYWREDTHDVPQTLANPRKGGIIDIGSDKMQVDIAVDRFTPCLEKTSTGEIVQTEYSPATKTDRTGLKKTGWNFNWNAPALRDLEIYKLTVRGQSNAQGMVALANLEKDKAIYISLAESSPTNIGKNKEYSGVGGHLFAIAAQRSVELGYNGFMFLDAKNLDLVEHYRKAFGAVHLGGVHPYRMIIDEEAAHELLKKYTLNEEG